MRYECYTSEADDTLMTFEFVSEGPKGRIKKRVIFQLSEDTEGMYNLAFGDVDSKTNQIDDLAVTNNNDRHKVLATVASIVDLFITKYPHAIVHAKGSTPARNRLYRMGISNNFEEINEDFYVYGLLNDKKWSLFEKNKNYSAFLIIRKNV